MHLSGFHFLFYVFLFDKDNFKQPEAEWQWQQFQRPIEEAAIVIPTNATKHKMNKQLWLLLYLWGIGMVLSHCFVSALPFLC